MPKIVQPFTWKTKVGYRDEVAEVARDWAQRQGLTPHIRLPAYTSQDWWTVTSDLVFETEEEQREFWANVDWSDPHTREAVDKLHDLQEGHTQELFRLLT